MEETEKKNNEEELIENKNSPNKLISLIIIVLFLLSIALVILAIIIYFAKDKTLSELEVYKKYEKLENITVSGNSPVYKVKDKKTNLTYALKEIKLNSNEIKNNVENDIKFMKACYNLSKISIHLIEVFEQRRTKFLVTELYNEDLSILLNKSAKPFDVPRVKNILIELNKLLKELRKKQVVHNNIKLESILVKNVNENKTEIKLSDYSKAKLLDKDGDFENTWNIKPFLDEKNYTKFEKQDLLDIGKETYRMLFKENNKTIEEMISKIGTIDDENLKELFSGLLKEDPEQRIDWDAYFNHSFFTSDDNN